MKKLALCVFILGIVLLFSHCKKDITTESPKPTPMVAPKDTTPTIDTALQVIIYPNPTIGPFTIQTNDNNSHTIQIVNTLGQTKFKEVVSGEVTTIDFLGLSIGMYFVSVTGKGATITKRIIIQ